VLRTVGLAFAVDGKEELPSVEVSTLTCLFHKVWRSGNLGVES
jgi:hypothetical protein